MKSAEWGANRKVIVNPAEAKPVADRRSGAPTYSRLNANEPPNSPGITLRKRVANWEATVNPAEAKPVADRRSGAPTYSRLNANEPPNSPGITLRNA